MNMKNGIVVFDMDGVLSDFESFLVSYLNEAHPMGGNFNRELYDLRERYGRYEGLYELAARFAGDPNAYYPLRKIEDGFAFLEEVLDRDYLTMICTSRPSASESMTHRWLRKEFHRYEELLGVKFVQIKSAYLYTEKINVEFMVDDNPEEIATAQRLGITSYAWAQPWSENVYPKVFRTRDGYTMLQSSEQTEARYFWEER